jgi:hypothetical protein
MIHNLHLIQRRLDGRSLPHAWVAVLASASLLLAGVAMLLR